jgi:hypothetical protein
MIKNVILFNDHGIGDLIWSKHVVNYISPHLTKNGINCSFNHKYNKNILNFDKNTTLGSYHDCAVYISPVDYQGMYPIHSPSICVVNENCLFINTWLLFSHSFVNNIYNQNNPESHPDNMPANLVNFDSLALLTNDVIDLIEKNCNISIPRATGDMLLPYCNKNSSKYNDIDNFFKNQVFSNYVLISNGDSRSGQTENFNIYEWLDPIIQQYSDWGFIFTEKKFKTNYKNVMTTSNNPSIQSLDNIEYMSTKCKVLFTRSSGPGHIFFNRDNCFDENKTIIAYTKYKNTAFLYDKGTCNYVWSNIFTQENLIDNFKKILY